jgi:hypothetical protein
METGNEQLFWNNRYQENETVYGYEPNLFFKTYLDKCLPGKLLLPCEGEGRNAIYAAKKGWQVTAFDFSRVAVEKALQVAAKEKVSIQYEQNSIEYFVPAHQFNLIALIYVHMAPAIRKKFIQLLITSLEDKGTIIIEGFNKEQINNSSGGPKDVNLMYSVEELKEDFKEMNIVLLEEKDIDLAEGEFHKGEASVIRLIATK